MTASPYRLPRTVRPVHYDLVMEPDLDAATFTGSASIEIEVDEPTTDVVVNAAELEIRSVVFRSDSWGERSAVASFDAELERVTFRVDSPLEAGGWMVDISFTGILNDRLRGFYRSTYSDPEGIEQIIATTQFESTDARRAFPCWDEPDFKATFGVTLVVDEGLMALSNGPEIGRAVREDGKAVVRFGTTMKMSTYLVAFVVGRLEATDPVDVDGVPLRVVHVPGKGRLARFALEAGAFCLDYLADYYGIPYPADKLDLVGIPDFAWGAMENLGCVTFRETALLIDDKRATQGELERVAKVIAHEIAHMWFGDLVTMKWWNGIWLNEAFARFMEVKTVDAWKPEWKLWMSFAAEGGLGSSSADIDALEATRAIEFPVESPSDADAMFDALTYGKGAAVLRMLEQYLGEEKFRVGVSDYLQWFSHGNARTKDLWEALERATGQPVGEMMDTWIFQGGLPVIEVGSTGPGCSLRQRHFRYLEGGDGEWIVPLLVRSLEDQHVRAVSLRAAMTVPIETPVVNAGGHGFYRVRYDDELHARLVDRLDSLETLERYALVADSWAQVLAASRSAADHLSLLERFTDETQPQIWESIAGSLAVLDGVASEAARSRFGPVVRELVGRAAERSGWSPRRHEPDLERRLRGTLLRAMGVTAEDGPTIDRARATFQSMIGGGSVDPDVASAALTITAVHGDRADYDRFWIEYERAASPQEQVRYLRAMATVPGDDLARETIDRIIAGEIRSQDSFWMIAVLVAGRSSGDAAWYHLAERWDDVRRVVPPSNLRRVIDTIPARSRPETASDIRGFLEDHPIPGGRFYVAQQLERLDVRVRLRSRETELPGIG